MKLDRNKLRMMILNEIRMLNEGLPPEQLNIMIAHANATLRNPNGRNAKMLKDILSGMKKTDPIAYNDAMSNDTIRKAAERVFDSGELSVESDGTVRFNGVDKFIPLDQRKREKQMSPRQLRKTLRSFPFNFKSGFTAYAKHKTEGWEGILVFGLSETDLDSAEIFLNLKELNRRFTPGRKGSGVKSVIIHDATQAKFYNIKGKSASVKRIEDDSRVGSGDSKAIFQKYLRDVKGKVFLIRLK
jgi:hypothetical protein